MSYKNLSVRSVVNAAVHTLAATSVAGVVFVSGCSSPASTPRVKSAVQVSTGQPAQRIPALKDLYAKDYLLGTAFDFRTPQEFSPAELEIIKTQFNTITPENSMKPGSLQPAEGQWNWAVADRLVEFCESNKMTLIGHTLVWHAQTGAWMFEGENGQPVKREVAIERLRKHIHTVVGRYKGKIKGWDVVNEAIADSRNGSTENLRNSPWLRVIGPDYLTLAFKFAREADPNVELYYNDYNIEGGDKHKSSLLLLKRLIAEGAPITGVGIQGHWSLTHKPFEELDQAIQNYKALGLKVMITELDVTIQGQGGGQLDQRPATRPAAGGPNGTTQPTTRRARRPMGPSGPATPAQLQEQAEVYKRFFEIFQKHKDVIERVTFWGFKDSRSWRQGQHPLLFNDNDQAKPALFSIAEVKKSEGR